ncbi:MAG: DinB family protein [Candidatus Rokubacteria bacterium]|nr:DinB family protein [Candidatus Rokubacteria bacterium]
MTPFDASALLAGVRRDLARLPAALDALLSDLDDARWRTRPAPKEWSPVEIVCHLRDEETEDFGARVRVVVDGGASFAPIDPAQWAVDRGYIKDDPRAALMAVKQRRRDNLAYLVLIDPARLTRVVDQPKLGKMSGLDLLAAWATHDRLHLAQLAATLAKIGADRWTGLRTEYAGPIPYGPTA